MSKNSQAKRLQKKAKAAKIRNQNSAHNATPVTHKQQSLALNDLDIIQFECNFHDLGHGMSFTKPDTDVDQLNSGWINAQVFVGTEDRPTAVCSSKRNGMWSFLKAMNFIPKMNEFVMTLSSEDGSLLQVGVIFDGLPSEDDALQILANAIKGIAHSCKEMAVLINDKILNQKGQIEVMWAKDTAIGKLGWVEFRI